MAGVDKSSMADRAASISDVQQSRRLERFIASAAIVGSLARDFDAKPR
jgi:hypothetical protein